MSERLARRILLLGWDAADWKIIQPLLDAGELPHLESVIDRGVMGNLATLQPILSPMLWTTIATGKRADRHGIHGFVEPRPDGLGVRPVSSTSLRARPLWSILEERGLRSAVVGWYATHPAEAVGGSVVSNHFPYPTGPDLETWPLPPQTVAPEGLRDIMRELRVHPRELAREQIEYFIPRLGEIDLTADRRPTVLARMLARAASVHAAGTYLAEHESWDLLAVYYDLIDVTCHEFMSYRPPRLADVSEDDVERYGEVVDRCYRFHDLMLGRYLSLVGPDTTVVIVSDHGFFSDHLRPHHPQRGGWGQPVWWHRQYGVLVASGPGLKQDSLVFGASLLDITPTVLAMLGLPVGRDMEGRVLTPMFERPVSIELIDTYERDAEKSVSVDATDDEDPWVAQEAIRQLAALGYVEIPDKDGAVAIEQASIQRVFNLAEVHFSKGEFERAAVLFDEVRTKRPEHGMARLRLAQCRIFLGDVEGCREIAHELFAGQPDAPWIHFAEGLIAAYEQRWEDALGHFHRARDIAPNLPGLHHRIGAVELARGRWGEAESAFRSALEIDGDGPGAFDGLGLAQYRQDRYEEAMETFIRSIALLYRQPLVHLHLAIALAATGRLDGAISSAQTALSFDPTLDAAHDLLSRIHRERGDLDGVAVHMSLAEVIRKRKAPVAVRA